MSIVLTNLIKRFGRSLVVNNVSLEIGEGELFVLLGGSGSGKSTILRLIAGLTEVDTGQIELNGRDVTYLPPQARGVGFVFQNYSIFRHMTVSANVEFGLRIRRAPLQERRQRSEELLEMVGLTGLGARYPDQLSGGQQQRVALARALAYRPEVLLLDEPFGALDVKIRAQLRESLKQIQQQLGVTTILVTHDQEEAFELADRIALIERGSLVEVGTPDELYHHPKTEFTAVFIGGGNVLIGRRERDEIQLGMVSLPFPPDAPSHDPGAPVRILFRPETVLLQATPFANRPDVHVLGQGRVIGQTFSGASHRVRLELEGLRGVRPVAPPLAYGQHATQIDALIQSAHGRMDSTLVGQTQWVGLHGYHVLSPTGLKVLLCFDDTPGAQAAAAFGLRLADAARGPITLLAVTSRPEVVAQVRDTLETVPHKWSAEANSRLTTRVRQGAVDAEILREAQEGFYEVVILGRDSDPAKKSTGLGSMTRRILTQAGIPVMLVKSSRERVERILICTAAGEPGKSVVRFGGRVARRVRANVTILHVLKAGTTQGERSHAELYLNQAHVFLEALAVNSEIKLEQGFALTHILAEAEVGDYDLLVIGAPAPRARQRVMWTDLATRIISGTSRPVAIVPMHE
jgi:sulfate/thiosulfate transport system ATP-binding protein